MKKVKAILFGVIFASFASVASEDGCQYDAQCKGDRICEKGECVAPSSAPVTPPPAIAENPSQFAQIVVDTTTHPGVRFFYVQNMHPSRELGVRVKVFQGDGFQPKLLSANEHSVGPNGGRQLVGTDATSRPMDKMSAKIDSVWWK
jgi:hypothetical protein